MKQKSSMNEKNVSRQIKIDGLFKIGKIIDRQLSMIFIV